MKIFLLRNCNEMFSSKIWGGGRRKTLLRAEFLASPPIRNKSLGTYYPQKQPLVCVLLRIREHMGAAMLKKLVY